jgi:DNA repair protein RadC
VHNHPSGNPQPSSKDKELNREVVYVTNVMQIKVLDHIIIGDNRYYSSASEGFIEEYKMDYLTLKIGGSTETILKTYDTKRPEANPDLWKGLKSK